MRRHWQVRRQMLPATDGARRWDRAYMLILGWKASGNQSALRGKAPPPHQRRR